VGGFDYLYDADGGFVGFRWTGHATPTIGKVVPSTARPAKLTPRRRMCPRSLEGE
jgi:hypothetical protein